MMSRCCPPPFFFFNDTATTEIYTLSLHDALPISTSSRSPPMYFTGYRKIASTCPISMGMLDPSPPNVKLSRRVRHTFAFFCECVGFVLILSVSTITVELERRSMEESDDEAQYAAPTHSQSMRMN